MHPLLKDLTYFGGPTQSGAVVWVSENGFNDWRADLQASLGQDDTPSADPGPYAWVDDVAMDRTCCLVCVNRGGESCTFVAPIVVGADGEPAVGPTDGWVEVEQQYVAKAASSEKPRPGSIGSGDDKGSYPITDEKSLKAAIQAYGRAKDKPAVMAHIKSKAKSLGLSDLIPDGWS